jgi:hypothetical protein
VRSSAALRITSEARKDNPYRDLVDTGAYLAFRRPAVASIGGSEVTILPPLPTSSIRPGGARSHTVGSAVRRTSERAKAGIRVLTASRPRSGNICGSKC